MLVKGGRIVRGQISPAFTLIFNKGAWSMGRKKKCGDCIFWRLSENSTMISKKLEEEIHGWGYCLHPMAPVSAISRKDDYHSCKFFRKARVYPYIKAEEHIIDEVIQDLEKRANHKSPPETKKLAFNIYRNLLLKEPSLVRGRRRQDIAAACVYIACERCASCITLRTVRRIAKEKKTFATSLQAIRSKLGYKYPVHPWHWVPGIKTRLKNVLQSALQSEKVDEFEKELYSRRLKDLGEFTRRLESFLKDNQENHPRLPSRYVAISAIYVVAQRMYRQEYPKVYTPFFIDTAFYISEANVKRWANLWWAHLEHSCQ